MMMNMMCCKIYHKLGHQYWQKCFCLQCRVDLCLHHTSLLLSPCCFSFTLTSLFYFEDGF